MARGTDFPEANTCLGAPEGMEDEVYPLPVLRRLEPVVGPLHRPDPTDPSPPQVARSTVDCCVSCWKLDADELAEIQRTGVVWLSVMGPTHPPLFVGGRKSDVLP